MKQADIAEVIEELERTVGITLSEEKAEKLLDQYRIIHKEHPELVDVAELVDEPNRTYAFGFPNGSDEKQIQNFAESVIDRLDEARTLLFTGDIDGDLVIGEIDPIEAVGLGRGEE